MLLSEPKMQPQADDIYCIVFLLQQKIPYTGHGKISATFFKEKKEKIILAKLYRTQTTQNEGLNTQQDTTGMLGKSKALIHFFRQCTLPNAE